MFSRMYKKNDVKCFQNLILPIGFNIGLKKNSKHFIFYEFNISFLQAISKNVNFFFCRYSKYLELVLEVLWNLHCIFGYNKIKLVNKYFLKIYIKKDFLGHSIVNSIYTFNKYAYVSWKNLKSLIFKENSVIYILNTYLGIKDGKLAVDLGLGGKLICKIIL